MATAAHAPVHAHVGNLDPTTGKYGYIVVWELPIRITHWVNALAILTLFFTGLYIAWPIGMTAGAPTFNFLMGRFREIHFIAGYCFAISMAFRIVWYFLGTNYARSGTPLFWRKSWYIGIKDQILEYLGWGRGPVRLGHNPLAGASYFGIMFGLGGFQILSGFALYSMNNRGGFWDTLTGWMIPLLGGAYRTQLWHHLAAWGFVVFIIMHLYFVTLDSFRYEDGLIDSIINGKKFYEKGDIDSDTWVS